MTAAGNLSGNARKGLRHRYGVLAMLLAWLSSLVFCPQAINGSAVNVPGFAIRILAGHQSYKNADADGCCAGQRHLSAVAQTGDFRIATVSILQAAPIIAAIVFAALPVAALKLGFTQYPPRIPRRSPASGALWPHAPPR